MRIFVWGKIENNSLKASQEWGKKGNPVNNRQGNMWLSNWHHYNYKLFSNCFPKNDLTHPFIVVFKYTFDWQESYQWHLWSSGISGVQVMKMLYKKKKQKTGSKILFTLFQIFQRASFSLPRHRLKRLVLRLLRSRTSPSFFSAFHPLRSFVKWMKHSCRIFLLSSSADR